MTQPPPALAPLSLLTLLCLCVAARAAGESGESIDQAQLEANGIVIGEIVLSKHDVFDLEHPKENNALFRLANQLHIVTKDAVIEKQLLLKPGDEFSERLAVESARILRQNPYFYDATITPKNHRDGTVDLHVETRDVWTLKPGFSFSRKGGENRTSVSLEELNLLGRGQKIFISSSRDVNRDSTTVAFNDRHLGNSWTSVSLSYANHSDGKTSLMSVVRPFYALDTRWAAGGNAFDDDRENSLYQLGEQAAEYRQERRYFSAFGGRSAGLRDGWVRRYTAGVVFDDNQFSEVIDGLLPPAVPDDRKLVYPFVGIEILEDSFETTRNHDQIMRTEDFLTGTRFSASLGWADDSFGADRDALVYTLKAARSFGLLEKSLVALTVDASGRIERGDAANSLLGVGARYYWRQSEKHTFFATLRATFGNDLDLDNHVELGGDTGLRGYPLRYQTGESKMLFRVEQRYFWDWYPFRLFRVGAAAFADIDAARRRRQFAFGRGCALLLAAVREAHFFCNAESDVWQRSRP